METLARFLEVRKTQVLWSRERPAEFKRARYCKKTCAGNVTEFVELSTRPTALPIVKLSATEYLNTLTGEVNDFQLSETRADNVDSLRKSFRQLRSIVNANVTDNKRIHWVTLTYAENMTDSERLYSDFKKFWQKFKRFCARQGWDVPEYIAAIEPQERGAWHMHVLLLWNRRRPFIDNNTIFAPMWGQGFTKIQGVPKDCDNLGAYLSAYLSDMAIADDEKSGKKYVKGARLCLYPVGIKIFRHSRGVKMPESYEVDPFDIEKEKASAGTLTYSASYQIEDDEGKTRYITKSYYNSKRPKSQGLEPEPVSAASEPESEPRSESEVISVASYTNTVQIGTCSPRGMRPIEQLLSVARALGVPLIPVTT